MVVCGCNFAFPIDFSSTTAVRLTSSKKWIESYAAHQAKLLQCGRAIAKLLVQEVRDYHRERVNALRPDPRVYSIGDKVFARQTVQSNKAKGRVNKAKYHLTGPWRVTAKLPGSSFEIKHELTGAVSKRHAAWLSPMPPELVPYAPVDGPDSRYGQLYKPLSGDAYKAAGIDGWLPPTPLRGALARLSPQGQPVLFPTVS